MTQRAYDSSPQMQLWRRRATQIISPIEGRVLQLVAKGLVNKEIAQLAHISQPAVKNHLQSITAKLEPFVRTVGIVHLDRTGLAVMYFYLTAITRPPMPREQRKVINQNISDAELRVLEFLPLGLTDAEIAKATELSPYTVKTHLARASKKLEQFASSVGVTHVNRTGMAMICLAAGVTKTR